MGGFASSRILEVHGERMIKRTFEPGFRIELHQKDLNLALAGARALGVALPNTATAQRADARPARPTAGTAGSFGAGARARADGESRGRAREGLSSPAAERDERPRRARIRAASCARCSTPRWRAALPAPSAGRFLPPPPKGRTLVLGAGKAAARWPRRSMRCGRRRAAVGPRRHALRPRAAGVRSGAGRIEVVEAAHPVPDAAGPRAAERIAGRWRKG